MGSLRKGHRPRSPHVTESASFTALEAVNVGDVPPDFELMDKDGKIVKLSSFRGKKPVVVFFYPNDGSPGCTKEVCAFEKAAPNFKKRGSPVILGISRGNKEDKKKFIEANKLQSMTLLIDTEDKVKKVGRYRKLFLGSFPDALHILWTNQAKSLIFSMI